MESERHAFMRKLLKLCVEAGVALVSTSALDVRNADGDWITTLVINVYGKTASGFWDGEKHEVWL